MESHKDNIGFLRLVFASAVIVGHAPELVDGDRHREPLMQLTGTLTLGGLAVDAFFLLSGYLITQSFIRQRSVVRYLERRVLRIYPAFIVAYLISAFLVAPIVGANAIHQPVEVILRAALLAPPMDNPTDIPGLRHRAVNGAMWTIAYEFRCYLLVILLGVAGFFRRRWLVAGLTAFFGLFMVSFAFAPMNRLFDGLGAHHRLDLLTGDLRGNVRFTFIFLMGSTFQLFRDEVIGRMRTPYVWAAAALTCVLLLYAPLAEAALTTLGGYCLFWLALKARLGPIAKINDRWDISYGTYLYGWPISIIIIYFLHPEPLLVAVATLPLAWLAGWLSWNGVERWAKDAVRSRRAPSVAQAA